MYYYLEWERYHDLRFIILSFAPSAAVVRAINHNSKFFLQIQVYKRKTYFVILGKFEWYIKNVKYYINALLPPSRAQENSKVLSKQHHRLLLNCCRMAWGRTTIS